MHFFETDQEAHFYLLTLLRMPPQTLLKDAPPPSGFLFPSPVDDSDDIFKVGPRYQHRWFQSQVSVPKGVLSWIDDDVFRPFAERLCIAVTAAGFPASLVEFNGRYVVNGRNLDLPPRRVNLPTCPVYSVKSFCTELEKRVRRGTEADALHWVEFLQSHLPVNVKIAMKNCPKLRQLLTD